MPMIRIVAWSAIARVIIVGARVRVPGMDGSSESRGAGCDGAGVRVVPTAPQKGVNAEDHGGDIADQNHC